MKEDRRYGEREVRDIFKRAGSREAPNQGTSTPHTGLTLAELQAIANEVGLSPERVADAASALDAPPATEHRNSLGMPISITRTAPLSRPLTDGEWELVVSELRSTFGVQGSARSLGSTREWTNGRLFAFVEPSEAGFRIRVGSSRPGAVVVNGAGYVCMGAAALVALVLLRTGDLANANAVIPVISGAAGLGTIWYNGSRLGRWAGKFRVQVEHVFSRVRGIAGAEGRAADQGNSTEAAPSR